MELSELIKSWYFDNIDLPETQQKSFLTTETIPSNEDYIIKLCNQAGYNDVNEVAYKLSFFKDNHMSLCVSVLLVDPKTDSLPDRQRFNIHKRTVFQSVPIEKRNKVYYRMSSTPISNEAIKYTCKQLHENTLKMIKNIVYKNEFMFID